MAGERLSIYDEVVARLLFDPRDPNREVDVSGRHGDDDGDGVANHIDPDWNDSAEMVMGDEDPDVWIGVTRENLPVLGPRGVTNG